MIVKYYKSRNSSHVDYRFYAGNGIWGRCWKARDLGRGWYATTDNPRKSPSPDFGKTRAEAVAAAIAKVTPS